MDHFICCLCYTINLRLFSTLRVPLPRTVFSRQWISFDAICPTHGNSSQFISIHKPNWRCSSFCCCWIETLAICTQNSKILLLFSLEHETHTHIRHPREKKNLKFQSSLCNGIAQIPATNKFGRIHSLPASTIIHPRCNTHNFARTFRPILLQIGIEQNGRLCDSEIWNFLMYTTERECWGEKQHNCSYHLEIALIDVRVLLKYCGKCFVLCSLVPLFGYPIF